MPIQSLEATSLPANEEIRSFISLAASFVNVRARIRCGSQPLFNRCTILYVKTRVFPEPAPAITREGPSQYSTASRCCLFSLDKGLALFLTFFIMSPVITQIKEEAIEPFDKGQITQEVALERGLEPLREVMYGQTQTKDVRMFVQIAGIKWDGTSESIPNPNIFS